MKNMQFAIIGLGRFGSVWLKSCRMGLDILAVDLDKNKVNLARDYATYAVRRTALTSRC